ncbi:unnamed protein product [Rotaria sordida]|uniref:Uncharacterized protein n=2 Tax=Rotaria sordida TaxID=392033 RepID=A0A815X1T2_9BILA|nr:unnamed protein product [Rotaria sordida]
MFGFVDIDAVSARFKIDPLHFNEFFRTCLRRTLAQMLCDVRRGQKRLMNNQLVGGLCGSASVLGVSYGGGSDGRDLRGNTIN